MDNYAKDGGPDGGPITQKMWFDFYVVFTMSLCDLQL